MATDLTSTSRFSHVRVGWDDKGYVGFIQFRTTTDADNTSIRFPNIRDYEDPAEDSNLAIIRDNYAENGGLLDSDDNVIVLTVQNFRLSDSDPPAEALSFYGFFNPFIAREFEGWLEHREILGAYIREARYSIDGDTERPIIKTPFDDIPIHRNPGSPTYEHSLSEWEAIQFGDSVQFTRHWMVDHDVTADNINDNFDILAFLDWLESIRTTGDAVGSDVLSNASFTNRTYQLNQGSGAATIDFDFNHRGQSLHSGGTYYASWSIDLERDSADTDEINIVAIRTLLAAATGTIDTSDESDEPEFPTRGSTSVPFHASEIVFPDGLKLKPIGTVLALATSDEGYLPLDGASVRSIRYADLEDVSGETNAKYMPNDGHAVVHFGHTETAHSIVRYRAITDMVLADGDDVIQRVHNVSATYRVTLEAPDGTTLLRLQPFEQSGPMQASLESGGAQGEILAIAPPDRHVILTRGHSAPNFSDGTSYLSLNNGVNDSYHTLRVQPNALEYADTDGWVVGISADPPAGNINSITPSDFAIRGQYQILRPGWVNINFRYRLVIQDPAPSGELARGNGPSLFISEGGGATFVRDHTGVAEAFGGTGAQLEYHLKYYGKHTANTRFLLLHYIPNASDIAEADYDHIDQEAFAGDLVLSPSIREVITT